MQRLKTHAHIDDTSLTASASGLATGICSRSLYKCICLHLQVFTSSMVLSLLCHFYFLYTTLSLAIYTNDVLPSTGSCAHSDHVRIITYVFVRVRCTCEEFRNFLVTFCRKLVCSCSVVLRMEYKCCNTDFRHLLH